MKYFLPFLFFISHLVFPKNELIKTYYEYGSTQDSTHVKDLKEEFEAIVKKQDTIKNGEYKLYFETVNKLKITGNYTNNLEEGEFISYYQNGNPKWIRNYKNGKLTGKELFFNIDSTIQYLSEYIISTTNPDLTTFKKFTPEGDLISETTLKNELIHGAYYTFVNGSKSSHYEFSEGKRNGAFEIFDTNGNFTQKGFFKNDRLEGKFITYFDNQVIKSFVHFSEGMLHDSLKEFHTNGKISREAFYNHDSLEGLEKIYFENGNLAQSTEFRHGLREGKMLLFYENSTQKSITNFEKGKREKEEIFYFENGDIQAKNLYKNDKLHGEAIKYFNDGKIEQERHFKEGLYTGTHLTFNKNQSIIKEEKYNEQGLLTSSKSFHEDTKTIAQIVEYEYQNCIPKSKIICEIKNEKDYSQNNILLAERNFQNRKKHGKQLTYNNMGVLLVSENYNLDKKTETQETYFESGLLQKKENYVRGLLEGEYAEYDENKKPVVIGEYHLNKKIGEWKYYKKGKVNYIEVYKNGKIISTSKK